MAASNARGEKDGDQDRSRERIDVQQAFSQLRPAMPSPPVVPSAVQPGELRCLSSSRYPGLQFNNAGNSDTVLVVWICMLSTKEFGQLPVDVLVLEK